MNLPQQRPLAVFLAFLASAVLGGCASVVSKGPVGTRPAVLDPEEWAGTWDGDGDGDVLKVQAIEPGEGVLQVSWIEVEDEKPALRTMPVYIREGDEWTYASYRDLDMAEDGEGPSPFYWGRIMVKDGFILAWAPDPSKFVTLVKSGKLPGTIDGDDVTLKKLEPGHFQMIEADAEGVLFLWDDPMILRRIGND